MPPTETCLAQGPLPLGLARPGLTMGLTLFSFDCLAELGVGLDLGLDASRTVEDDYIKKEKLAAERKAPEFPVEQVVSLAWEDLERVPSPVAAGLGTSITVLDLSHNRLRDVDFLSALPGLTSLVLDHNLLHEDISLPRLPRLRLLWLNHNQIRVAQPLAKRLQRSAPRLRHLSLIGNRAAPSPLSGAEPGECARYRLSMVWLLPQLEHLDERRVTPAERARSKHLQLRAIFNSTSNIPCNSSSHSIGLSNHLRRHTCI